MADRIAPLEARLSEAQSQAPGSTTEVDALNALAWEIGLVDPERTDRLVAQAAKLADALGYDRGTAHAQRTVGYRATMTASFGDALRITREALATLRRIGDREAELTALNTVCTVHWRLGGYDKALAGGLACLALSRELGDVRAQAWAHHNLGAIHLETGELERAEQELTAAAECFGKANYETGLLRVLGALGTLALRRGEPTRALDYQQQAYAMAERSKIPMAIAWGNFEIGMVLVELGEHERALGHLDTARVFFEEGALEEALTRTLIWLARAHEGMGLHDEARRHLEAALEKSEAIGTAPTQAEAHLALSALDEDAGDHAKALAHHKAYQKVRDTVAGDEARAKLNRLRSRADVESAEKEAEIHRLRYVELAQMQARLVETERMAMLGKLVAGLAHELNTPVGVIKSSADATASALGKLAKSRTIDDPGRRERLEQGSVEVIRRSSDNVRAANERIAELVNSLRNFVRIDEAETQDADLHEGIHSTLALLAPRVDPGVTITRKLGDLPVVRCQPHQLNRVFMTLLANAIDAVGDAGHIEVASTLSDNEIHIRISDDGCGIEADRLERIFDIGFSEKNQTMRMHVGLASALDVVRAHRGRIDVESELGVGTVFTIVLPTDADSTAV
jgi:two-component system NtrC family sensor kinase